MSSSLKRSAEDSESSDDDFGPVPVSDSNVDNTSESRKRPKKIRKLKFEHVRRVILHFYVCSMCI